MGAAAAPGLNPGRCQIDLPGGKIEDRQRHFDLLPEGVDHLVFLPARPVSRPQADQDVVWRETGNRVLESEDGIIRADGCTLDIGVQLFELAENPTEPFIGFLLRFVGIRRKPLEAAGELRGNDQDFVGFIDKQTYPGWQLAITDSGFAGGDEKSITHTRSLPNASFLQTGFAISPGTGSTAGYCSAMEKLLIDGPEQVLEMVGQTAGPTGWREVTQEMIDTFAELSGDFQWIHVDVSRAETESPFGGTIAHGNLTLATIDGFRVDLVEVGSGFALGVNYGWNKVRFPAPVPAGSSLRASAELVEANDLGNGWLETITRFTVEVRSPDGEISPKPCCVGESVTRLLAA